MLCVKRDTTFWKSVISVSERHCTPFLRTALPFQKVYNSVFALIGKNVYFQLLSYLPYWLQNPCSYENFLPSTVTTCFYCHPLYIPCVSLFRALLYHVLPCAPLYTLPVCHCKSLSPPVTPCMPMSSIVGHWMPLCMPLYGFDCFLNIIFLIQLL